MHVKALSHILDEIKGSTKTHTFKRYKDKRKQIICRDKVALPYVRTSLQAEQRNKFKAAKDAWNALTDEEKQQWNIEGNKQRPPLTGYQYFIKCYLTAPPYTYYEVTIQNTTSEALTDYTILINIENNQQFFTDCQNAREHIRLYAADKTTPLNYWIEEWNTGTYSAKIWVKIPSIQGNSTIYAYIRIDNNLTTDESNGENTFLFFDDAQTDKSSSYELVDIFNSGLNANFTYDSANKEYNITITSDDIVFCKIVGLNLKNLEIYSENKASAIGNANFGHIERYQSSDNSFMTTRGKTFETPDRKQVAKFIGKTAISLIEENLDQNYAPNTYYTILSRAYENKFEFWAGIGSDPYVAYEGSDVIQDAGPCGILACYSTGTVISFKNVRVRHYISPEPIISIERV